MRSIDIFKDEQTCIFQTYARFPVLFTKGKGVKLVDNEGKEYLDFLSGIAVNALGHCHPAVVNAIKTQAKKISHTSNLYYTIPQVKLAKLLAKLSGLDRSFFCNSGAEANEAAIKLARKYGKENLGEGKYEIITMQSSFHGRTMATLTATGQEKIRKGFDPLLEGFKYVKYNDLEELKAAVSEKTCAIMLEPVQGEGGVIIPENSYLKGVRELCDSKNILMILDEVQTGVGRTGKMFAYEHAGIKPDILTLAKAIGGGLPLGVMMSSEKISKAFIPGTHGSTFGGGPIVCAAGIAVLDYMLKKNVLKNVNEMGAYFVSRLNELKSKHSVIKNARGKGLICGLELSIPGKEIVGKMLKHGVLINCTADTVLRFLPPLIVSKKHIDRVIKELDAVLKES